MVVNEFNLLKVIMDLPVLAKMGLLLKRIQMTWTANQE